MHRKVLLVLGSLLALASFGAALFVPVSVPVAIDALTGLGVVAGLLLVFSHDFRAVPAPEIRPAVHVKRRRAQRAAARAAARTHAERRTVPALLESVG